MNIKVTSIYPKDENTLNKIEIEKYIWLLARLRELYSEDMIKMAAKNIINSVKTN